MKTKLIFLLWLVFISSQAYPQTGWINQSLITDNLFHGVYFINESTGFIVGDNGTLLKTTNSGVEWVIKNSGTTRALHKIIFINSEVGIIVGEFGTVLRSVNAGENWSLISTSLPANVTGNCNRVTFANSTTGFIASCSGILKSTNAGLNWSLVYPTSTYLFGFNFVNANTGMAIGDNSLVIRTTDGGINWSNVSLGSFNYQLCGITSTNENIFYIVGGIEGSSSTMLRTTNFGDEWILMNTAATNRLNTVQFANAVTGYAVGCSGNILKTTNSGINWYKQQINTSRDLWDISVISSLTAVISGKSGGIFRTDNGGLTNISLSNTSMPKEFNLSQNYPNPFNPLTNIKFSILKNSKVSLNVFDINGKLVENLVENTLSPGNYSVDWDASLYNSGTYLYRLETGEGIMTKKMVLIK